MQRFYNFRYLKEEIEVAGKGKSTKEGIKSLERRDTFKRKNNENHEKLREVHKQRFGNKRNVFLFLHLMGISLLKVLKNKII